MARRVQSGRKKEIYTYFRKRYCSRAAQRFLYYLSGYKGICCIHRGSIRVFFFPAVVWQTQQEGIRVDMESGAMQLINALRGRKLERFCCEAEILDFDFGTLTLHAMGCSRVIKNNDILVTVPDYQAWDGVESRHNDEWYNTERFRAEITGGIVCSTEVSPWNDLRVILDNGCTIECLIANAYPHYGEESEQWVLFEHTKDHSGAFLTVFSKRVHFQEGTAPDSGR